METKKNKDCEELSKLRISILKLCEAVRMASDAELIMNDLQDRYDIETLDPFVVGDAVSKMAEGMRNLAVEISVLENWPERLMV